MTIRTKVLGRARVVVSILAYGATELRGPGAVGELPVSRRRGRATSSPATAGILNASARACSRPYLARDSDLAIVRLTEHVRAIHEPIREGLGRL
jgi:hypothetical protein